MKHLYLLAGLGLAAPHLTYAQAADPLPAHVLSAGVFGLAPGLGVQDEHRLSRHFSLSVRAAYYFSANYPGYQAALGGRYYFQPVAPTGLYAQAEVGVFQHDGQIRSVYPGSTPTQSTTRLGGPGVGLGLGYQLLVGRHLAFNASLGLKYYHVRNLYYCDCGYVGDWYAAGQPGSFLDGQLTAGYAF